jgi:cobalamin biosynthesis Co2+ chelatase CbiK
MGVGNACWNTICGPKKVLTSECDKLESFASFLSLVVIFKLYSKGLIFKTLLDTLYSLHSFQIYSNVIIID